MLCQKYPTSVYDKQQRYMAVTRNLANYSSWRLSSWAFRYKRSTDRNCTNSTNSYYFGIPTIAFTPDIFFLIIFGVHYYDVPKNATCKHILYNTFSQYTAWPLSSSFTPSFEMNDSHLWFPQNTSQLIHYYTSNHNFTKYVCHETEKFLI